MCSPDFAPSGPTLRSARTVIKDWKMVKKILPLIGTLPFLLISLGLIRTNASSGKDEKEL